MKRHLLSLVLRTRGGRSFTEVQKRINGLQESAKMSDHEIEQWYRFVQNAIEDAKSSARNNARNNFSRGRWAKKIADRYMNERKR